MHGSGALIRWLLERELVDEMILLIVPVVLGQGARLFPDAGPEIALDPLDSRTDSKGVTIQVLPASWTPAARRMKDDPATVSERRKPVRRRGEGGHEAAQATGDDPRCSTSFP